MGEDPRIYRCFDWYGTVRKRVVVDERAKCGEVIMVLLGLSLRLEDCFGELDVAGASGVLWGTTKRGP
jgi:hypothetical protein